METQQQINTLQSRQLELLAIMARSDDHAAKCRKMGLKFWETYPKDFDDYQAANEEYNANEAALAKLISQRSAEEQAQLPQTDL